MTLCRLIASVTLFVSIPFPVGPTGAHAEGAEGGDTAERLRVGLVLGGGGARGATHVGVLRELERLQVPIDAIAGTSMGALVGGLYAAGMTADELAALIGSVDWAAAVSDEPRRNDLDFRRKQDDEQFPIDFKLGLEDGRLRVPMGLVQGHRLDLLLHELTLDVLHIRDFDELPIPFRAVASDIERAEAYVIDSGSLPHALRASMSVPGIFAPVMLDDRLLVDGGLVANLPVDVMGEMDVDVIIAVNAEFPLYSGAELDSALKVSEQVITILIRRETLRQIELLDDDDILLQPELGTLASSDFGAALDTVDPGAAAARAAAGRLRALAVEESVYAEYTAQRTAVDASPVTLDFVHIRHDGKLSNAALRARIRLKAGDPADPARLAADADRIYGLGLYEKVNYHIVEEDGQTGVVYEARAKSWGRNDLQFGLSLEDDFDGSTAFNVAARLTRVGINGRGAEWRTDVQLGTSPLLFTELYQPLASGSDWFVAPRIRLRRFNRNAFQEDDLVAKRRISESEFAFDIGRELGRTGEVRFGVFRGNGESRVNVGDPVFSRLSFATGGVFASVGVDTLDDAHFPARGMRGELRWRGSRPGLGADAQQETYELDVETHWTRGRGALQLGLNYATTIDATGAAQDLFPLGGFLRLSGLDRGAISGPHAALLRFGYRRRLGTPGRGLFDLPVYVGASLEAGNVWSSRSAISLDSARLHGSIYAALDTYFGPVFLAGGIGEGGDTSFYLFIGVPPR